MTTTGLPYNAYYICVSISIYVYVCIEREREGETEILRKARPEILFNFMSFLK